MFREKQNDVEKNDRNEEEIRLEEKVGRRFEGRGQKQQPETRNLDGGHYGAPSAINNSVCIDLPEDDCSLHQDCAFVQLC